MSNLHSVAFFSVPFCICNNFLNPVTNHSVIFLKTVKFQSNLTWNKIIRFGKEGGHELSLEVLLRVAIGSRDQTGILPGLLDGRNPGS